MLEKWGSRQIFQVSAVKVAESVDKLWKQAEFAGESKTQDIVFVHREK